SPLSPPVQAWILAHRALDFVSYVGRQHTLSSETYWNRPTSLNKWHDLIGMSDDLRNADDSDQYNLTIGCILTFSHQSYYPHHEDKLLAAIDHSNPTVKETTIDFPQERHRINEFTTETVDEQGLHDLQTAIAELRLCFARRKVFMADLALLLAVRRHY